MGFVCVMLALLHLSKCCLSPHGNGCGTRKKKEEGRGERKKFDGDDKRCSCKRAQSKEGGTCFLVFIFAVVVCAGLVEKSELFVLLSNISYQKV